MHRQMTRNCVLRCVCEAERLFNTTVVRGRLEASPRLETAISWWVGWGYCLRSQPHDCFGEFGVLATTGEF